VFGHVTEGMDVADAISRVRTTRQGNYENLPEEPVVMNRVYVQTGK
jgi:cyclophilin family peptidyl-prolyl cis-trans isomerase